MGAMEDANDKWKRKTKAAGPAWENGKTSAISRDAYSKGFTAKGFPAPRSMNENWKKELGATGQDKFVRGVEAAVSQDKWKEKFAAALSR